MTHIHADIGKKILSAKEAAELAYRVKFFFGKVVFTNGCFDLLHPGHVDYLTRAKEMGQALIVGLNSDESIRKLVKQGAKSEDRPLVPQGGRAYVLAALYCVDAVVVFDQDTPLELVKQIQPDVLVKGGDWPVEKIVGAQEVLAHGGMVKNIPLLEGFSTTGLVQTIRERAKA